jgi:hypothetical protein
MTKQLSTILQNNFNVPAEEYGEAQALAVGGEETVGQILVQKNLITEHQLLEALGAII